MSTKRLFGGTAFEAQMHSLHSECKNVQKSVLTNVNFQTSAEPHFQMFAFSFFGGKENQRCLQIFCPSSVPRHNFCPSKIMLSHWFPVGLYLQMLDSASESRFCVGK